MRKRALTIRPRSSAENGLRKPRPRDGERMSHKAARRRDKFERRLTSVKHPFGPCAAPFAELVRLSRTSIADEMRIKQVAAVLIAVDHTPSSRRV